MEALKQFFTINLSLDEDTKGGLWFLAWIAWVLVVMGAAQHFGWVTP